MKIRKVLLANHFYFTKSGPVYGPTNVLCEYFRKKTKSYLMLDYPLILGHKPFYEKFDGKNIIHKNFGLNINLPLPIKSFLEIISTLTIGLFFKADLFIGVDPLNALPGIFLKKLGLVKKTIFYSVDYTPTRFENIYLNAAYQKIDIFCARFSDEVWNVSSRIVNLRINQNVKSEKIKFLPNSPNFDSCPRLPSSKVNKNKIVMITGGTHSPIFSLVLKSFKNVLRVNPKLTMNIIGTGEYENNLKMIVKNMGLSSKIDFLGQLENRAVLEEIAKCRLGLALYPFSKKYSWIYYGDSKKTREYLACGVPVVMNDVVATSEDVKRYHAGLVVKLSREGISAAIEKMVMDDEFWVKCRQNAICLARDNDFEKILDSLLQD